jgi:drug/metabolite transporter (DMT)-like permease
MNFLNVFSLPALGELAALGSALVWSFSITLYTLHGKDIPAHETNLFRSLVALIILGAGILITQPVWPQDPASIGILALSGLIGLAIGDSAFFASLKRLGAQNTSASQCLSPGMAALLAFGLLGEKLSLVESLGIAVTILAVTGAVLLGSPENKQNAAISRKNLLIGIGFALTAAFCQAISIVMSRFAFQNMDVLVGTTLRIAPATIALYLFMLLKGHKDPFFNLKQKRLSVWLWIALASFMGSALGLVLQSTATKHAKAGIASAISSSYPIWLIPLAWFILREKVRPPVIILTIVAVSGIGLMMV